MLSRISYPFWFKGFVFALLFAILGFNILFPPKINRLQAVSPIVLDKDGQWLSAYAVDDGTWRLAVKIVEVDPRFLERLIAYEDKRFYQHSGVDPLAIIRAGRSFIKQGQAVSGASTITMQLVRLLEPRPRTFTSKVIESFRALQLELFLSKTEILEAYLTFAPYGGNLEGIKAASLSYLGKPPSRLTDAEIALLIALPQSPEVRRPDLHKESARTGRAKVLNKLNKFGLISEVQAKEASDAIIPEARLAIPEIAWITGYGLTEGKPVTRTTLDRQLQADLEMVTQQYVSKLDESINTAITIVENKTMSVRAHIASADRDRPGGWIDMTRQSRSPGSTLKPFIYGLAIDDGLISTASVLHDKPTRFGTYQPENFNRRYYGKVRVFEALRHSLNVPAVAVLDKIGGQRFEDSLVNVGVNMERYGGRGERAGLALALGGSGLTVNDLAMLYAGLANDGRMSELKWRQSDVSDEYQLFSEKTANKITDILRQAPTPSGRVPSWLSKDAPPIAYKTGTSYGFRDAWAAGYTKNWTVIVWTGRPDGGPRPGKTGRLAAAPLLFDVFSLLPIDGRVYDFAKDDTAPDGLQDLNQGNAQAPQIIFPPDQAQLYTPELGAEGRGFTLSAQAVTEHVRFYVDGSMIKPTHGRTIWHPESAGFYALTVVDEAGRAARSNIEVITAIP